MAANINMTNSAYVESDDWRAHSHARLMAVGRFLPIDPHVSIYKPNPSFVFPISSSRVDQSSIPLKSSEDSIEPQLIADSSSIESENTIPQERVEAVAEKVFENKELPAEDVQEVIKNEDVKESADRFSWGVVLTILAIFVILLVLIAVLI